VRERPGSPERALSHAETQQLHARVRIGRAGGSPLPYPAAVGPAYGPDTFTDRMTTGSVGCSSGVVGTAPILSTTSWPSVTLPSSA
jgi:hypothetical protein